jgi:hypothetical protein
MPSYFSVLLLLLLAWGALAFGAVYTWAYTPLFWAAAALGLLGWFAPGAEQKPRTQWAVAVPLALVVVGAGLQLIPLPLDRLARLSPAADAFLSRYDVAYALAKSSSGAAAAGYRHPLSIDPAATRVGLAALVSLGLLLVGTARGLGRASLRALAAGIVALGTLLALVAIVQFGLSFQVSGRSNLIYGFWKPQSAAIPFGPFVNRNHFAGWMLLALPVSLGCLFALMADGMRGAGPTLRERVLWLSSRDASRVVLVGLAILVMGVSLVVTLSRSGISGFLAAVLVAGWFVWRRQARGSRRVAGVAYLALVVTLALGWVGVDALAARFAPRETRDLGGRLPIWEDTVTVIRDFPWTGTGLNTYATSMLLYQRFEPETRTAEAHNDYLQLAAEGGVLLGVPAAAALAALVWLIRRRFRERADDESGYWLRLGATTGLVAIALQETVEFSLQMPGIAALFAVVAAMAIRPSPPRLAPFDVSPSAISIERNAADC